MVNQILPPKNERQVDARSPTVFGPVHESDLAVGVAFHFPDVVFIAFAVPENRLQDIRLHVRGKVRDDSEVDHESMLFFF